MRGRDAKSFLFIDAKALEGAKPRRATVFYVV
jgi:hypothetical protein